MWYSLYNLSKKCYTHKIHRLN